MYIIYSVFQYFNLASHTCASGLSILQDCNVIALQVGRKIAPCDRALTLGKMHENDLASSCVLKMIK